MQEDFLHYIWKYQNFVQFQLQSVSGESIEVIQPGIHNRNSGPDFFNAKIRIGGQLWAGNVEIHLKASDWYAHHHEKDRAYDNVILHVVWDNDSVVYRPDNSELTALELAQYVNKNLEFNYNKLITSKAWINCESDLGTVDEFLFNNWLERLYINRLQRKSQEIDKLLKASQNDWEAVLFKMLLKSFGLKVNGKPFESLAASIPFSVVRKLRQNSSDLEALFFGQSHLLEKSSESAYFKDLRKRYQFLKSKFEISNSGVVPASFFRLRPTNFPTIRLSQFANLYGAQSNLFSSLMSSRTTAHIYELLGVSASDFWKNHFTFSKTSKQNERRLTTSFIDLIIINCIVPIKFSFSKAQGRNVHEELLELMRGLKAENNTVFERFSQIRTIPKNALVSQALLELKFEFCDKNQCLQCSIGNSLILKN